MMNPTALKAKFKDTIYNGLKAQFTSSASQGQGYTPIADAQWELVAEAISGIAVDIVTEITTNAEVPPGIATPAGPTTGTGHII